MVNAIGPDTSMPGPEVAGDDDSMVPARRPDLCEHCGVPSDSAAHWWHCATLQDGDEGEDGGR
jgi:hypothetical protein